MRRITENEFRMLLMTANIMFDDVGYDGIIQRLIIHTFGMSEWSKKNEFGYTADMYMDTAFKMINRLDQLGLKVVGVSDLEHKMTKEEFIDVFNQGRDFEIFGWESIINMLSGYYFELALKAERLEQHDKYLYYYNISHLLVNALRLTDYFKTGFDKLRTTA